MTNETKRKSIGLMVFLVPVLLVKVAAVMFGVGGPTDAEAAVPAAGNAVILPSHNEEPTFDSSEVAAAEHLASLHGKPFGPSPLLSRGGAAPDLPPDVPMGNQDDPATLDVVPELLIGFIIASSSGEKALINQKVYAEGDSIAGTKWVIIDINHTERSVTIEHTETHRTIVERIAKPLSDGEKTTNEEGNGASGAEPDIKPGAMPGI